MAILVVKGHAKITKQGYLIVVKTPQVDPSTGKKKYVVSERMPILELEMLVITGGQVSVTTSVLLALTKAGIPVTIHGLEAEASILPPFLQAHTEARKAQHHVAENPDASLAIAKQIIEAKIRGLANLTAYLEDRVIRRRTARPSELKNGITTVHAARTRSQLLTAEANLTRKAWDIIREAIPDHYGFPGRIPRARDPINSAISYTYAILYTLATHALTAAGLDPHIGLLHRDRPGARSLTYDYTEQFKPLAIHAVIAAARKTKIETTGDGTLDAKSLEQVTMTLYSLLKRRPTGRTKTNRAYIYTKAWELRNTIVNNTKYKPYIYNPR